MMHIPLAFVPKVQRLLSDKLHRSKSGQGAIHKLTIYIAFLPNGD